MPDLHRDQQAALDALGWLLSERDAVRQQGRSTIQAIALIRHALSHPELRVPIAEFGSSRRSRALAMVTMNLVESDPRLTNCFRHDLLLNHVRQPVLCFDHLPGSFPEAESWLPPGWRPAASRRPPRVNVPDLTEEALAELLDEDHQSVSILRGDGVHIPVAGLLELQHRINSLREAWNAPPAEPQRPPEPPPSQSLWHHLEDD